MKKNPSIIEDGKIKADLGIYFHRNIELVKFISRNFGQSLLGFGVYNLCIDV